MQETLADALMDASREWAIELHFQKCLAGAPTEVIAAAKETPMNLSRDRVVRFGDYRERGASSLRWPFSSYAQV